MYYNAYFQNYNLGNCDKNVKHFVSSAASFESILITDNIIVSFYSWVKVLKPRYCMINNKLIYIYIVPYTPCKMFYLVLGQFQHL